MILSIFNNKGGVGKTTTAVNLAAGLASARERALLIDLDGQSSASFHLGLSRDCLKPSVAELLQGECTSQEAVRPTSVKHLDILPGSPRLCGFDLAMAQRPNHDLVLREALGDIVQGYRWVIMDCPPALSLLTRNAVLASDGLLIPVAPGYLALEGLAGLMEELQSLRARYPQSADILGILPTMVDYRNRLTGEVLELLREHFANTVTGTEVKINVRLAEASSFGKSIFDYDRRCQGSRDYRSLIQEVRNLCRVRKVA